MKSAFIPIIHRPWDVGCEPRKIALFDRQHVIGGSNLGEEYIV